MKLYNIYTPIVAIFLLAVPGMSQQTIQVVEQSKINAYYSLLDFKDDPDCSGAGKLAVSVPITASRIAFRLHDKSTNTFSDVQGNAELHGGNCRVMARQGVEIRWDVIDCPEGQRPQINEMIDKASLSLSIDGEVRICMSPIKTEITGGKWRAEIIVNGSASMIEGQIFPAKEQLSLFVIASDFENELRDEPYMIASLPYIKDSLWLWNENVDRQLLPRLKDRNSLITRLDCLPISFDERATEVFYLEASAIFYFADQPVETCDAQTCPSFADNAVRWNRNSLSRSAKACTVGD